MEAAPVLEFATFKNPVVPAEGGAGEDHGRIDVPADIDTPCESGQRAGCEVGTRPMGRARKAGTPCRAFRESGPRPA